MTMFCNCAHPLVPGIASLDNFYAKQHADGEICREINRGTGKDCSAWVNREGRQLFSRWGWTGVGNEAVVYQGRPVPQPPPDLTLDALNHPILAWAEIESYRVTGDRQRLGKVYEPLVHYYRALQKYVRQGNGLYMTDWASMDNSPRNTFLKGGGSAIDTSSQMVLFGRNLATIAESLGKASEATRYAHEADQLGQAINALMWDPARHFYFDLTIEGKRAPVKTVAGFWPLLAEVASAAQAEDLVKELENPATFKRWHRVPTLAADQASYDPAGGYWRGAVWAPTTTMVIRGLERYGHAALGRQIALNHLAIMGEVFQKTGTVWENYAPDAPAPGRPAKPDFVGWSGIGPIMYLLEFAIGLKPDAASDTLVWEVAWSKLEGVKRFRFNGHEVSLTAEPAGGDGRLPLKLSVVSDGPFRLVVRHAGREQVYPVAKGQNAWPFPQQKQP